jgi:hypothetical protein
MNHFDPKIRARANAPVRQLARKRNPEMSLSRQQRRAAERAARKAARKEARAAQAGVA